MSQVTVPSSDQSGIGTDLPLPSPEPAATKQGSGPRRGATLTALGLLGLTALSLALRMRGLGISLWLDEGLSAGIASHPLADIPGLLVQDGSPPLYYLVLHGWTEVFGRSEEALRALSLVFALACIPVAFWAAGSFFGRRAGWMGAVLAATSSYLTVYSRETRMYTLVVLVSLVCVAAFVHGFAFRHRRWLPVFVVSLALALYTHNWSLYLAVGLGLAALVCLAAADDRPRALRDTLVSFGVVGVLYAPWLPTLLAQAARTGAPWSQTPSAGELLGSLESVLGDGRVAVILVLVALPALVPAARRWRSATGAAVVGLAVALAVTVGLSWASSQVQPAWASRYFGVFLAPLLLLAAAGLARDRRRGLLALALIVVIWADPLSRLPGVTPPRIRPKSNVREALTLVADTVGPGDVVVSTHMEHVPLLHHYLGPELAYADPSGLVSDPTVADWRDALQRLRAATPERGLVPLVDELGPGGHLLLVCPRLDTNDDEVELEWFTLMGRHCSSWRAELDGDPSMVLVEGPVSPKPRRSPGSSVFLLVYEKLS